MPMNEEGFSKEYYQTFSSYLRHTMNTLGVLAGAPDMQ